MIVRILSAVSVAALCGGAVFAQNADETAPAAELTAAPVEETAPAILAADATKVTNLAEAKNFGEVEFVLADADADGKLTLAEFVGYSDKRDAAKMEAKLAAEAGLTINAAADAETAAMMPEDHSGHDMADMTHDTGEAQDMDTAMDADAATAEAAPAVTAETIFTKIAGEAETIDREALIAARVASFEEADADDDGALAEDEQAAFTALVWGESAKI